jgi:hypothetical protein
MAEFDEMLVALAVGKLHEAQAIAPGKEAHGFGVHGDWALGESHLGGQVVLVQMNGHFHSRSQGFDAL